MNQMRAITILVISLLVLGGVAWLLAHKDVSRDASQRGNNTSIATTSDSTSTPVIDSEGSLNFSARSLKRSNDRYTIDLTYPHADGEDKVAAAINKQLESFVAKQVNDFEAETADLLPRGEGAPVIQTSLHSTYEVKVRPKANIAWVSVFTDYYTGGAHPGHTYTTFNFDTTTGREIALPDLFRSDSKYLSKLSNISREMLTSKLGDWSDPEFIADGTKPDVANFSTFLLTDSGLKIIFNEYQVAAYVAGPQKITIPYNELADVLSPTGPLAAYAK